MDKANYSEEGHGLIKKDGNLTHKKK